MTEYIKTPEEIKEALFNAMQSKLDFSHPCGRCGKVSESMARTIHELCRECQDQWDTIKAEAWTRFMTRPRLIPDPVGDIHLALHRLHSLLENWPSCRYADDDNKKTRRMKDEVFCDIDTIKDMFYDHGLLDWLKSLNEQLGEVDE